MRTIWIEEAHMGVQTEGFALFPKYEVDWCRKNLYSGEK